MAVLKFFVRTDNEHYVLYKLKDNVWLEFINSLTVDFRLCYIQDPQLKELSRINNVTESVFLENYVLPDDPIIKSGDFGEILCYFAVMENYQNKNIIVNGPKKWQWKENRNKAAYYCDAILFHRASDDKFTENDLLVSVESKMKATANNNNPIQNAIKDAEKDKLTRLAKTLNWLEEKYARLGDIENKELTVRFKDPIKYGDYKKQYKAIALFDQSMEEVEIAKKIDIVESIELIIFSISELRNAYEQTRLNIIKSI